MTAIPFIIIAVLAVVLGLWITMSSLRRNRYGLVLWLPCAILCPAAIWHVTLGSSGPWAGIVVFPLWILGGVFWIVTLLLWPKTEAYNWIGGCLGMLVCVVVPAVWYFASTELAQIQVVDQTGRSVEDHPVSFAHTSWGRRGWDDPIKTNAQGLASIRVYKSEYWAARTTSADGTHCEVRLGRPELTVDVQANKVVLSQYWQNSRWTNWVASNYSHMVVRQGLCPLPLRLRSEAELVSPWVLQHLTKRIQAAENAPEKGRFDLGLSPHSPEIYPLIPGLLALLRSGRLDHYSFESLVRHLAQALSTADSVVAKPAGSQASEDAVKFRYLCTWIDPDQMAKDQQLLARRISAQIAAHTAELIEILTPIWPEKGLIGFSELGPLMKPHYAQVFEVMTKASAASLPGISDKLIRAKPAPEVAMAYVNHPNREVAVTAILVGKANLGADRVKLLLRPLSHPQERNWLQYLISDELNEK